jgi:hypothetical protein
VWIYVAKWYGDSAGKWKNLYYRGTGVNVSAATCSLEWDSLPRQNPGIWFSDDQNNMRVVVGTKVTMPKNAASCLKDHSKNPTLEFEDANATKPTQRTEDTCDLGSQEKYVEMDLLEYADLNDFPIGEWFHFVMVVTPQRIELYQDAKLVQTTVFVGRYADDCTTRGFFSVGHPITGRISNFRFMPQPLPIQMIEYLYKTEGAQAFKKQKDPMREWDNSYG